MVFQMIDRLSELLVDELDPQSPLKEGDVFLQPSVATRLTLNVFTHAELADQTAAIEVLPGPPAAKSC
jgi:hypothetical protein